MVWEKHLPTYFYRCRSTHSAIENSLSIDNESTIDLLLSIGDFNAWVEKWTMCWQNTHTFCFNNVTGFGAGARIKFATLPYHLCSICYALFKYWKRGKTYLNYKWRQVIFLIFLALSSASGASEHFPLESTSGSVKNLSLLEKIAEDRKQSCKIP